MKINIPVTDVEHVLTEQDSVVSKTDLGGIITYINEDFLRISGFTQNELIGASHNIVRHPDMPPEEIVSSIRSVTAIMSEISAASVEQTSGIEQVNQAIGQMDDVTQQNAALVEQAAAAAESLEEQAQNLVNTVGSFKVDDHSASSFFRPQDMLKTNKEPISPHRKLLSELMAKSQLMDNNHWEEF
jgi:transcriptional regulator with PAS, ATPase and Fis domain